MTLIERYREFLAELLDTRGGGDEPKTPGWSVHYPEGEKNIGHISPATNKAGTRIVSYDWSHHPSRTEGGADSKEEAEKAVIDAHDEYTGR